MVKVEQANGKDGEQFRKLFIGGLSMSTTDDQLKEYYSQFGTVTDCVVMKDPQTKRSRGFGFVTYTNREEVDAAMKARPHNIDGKVTDPKRAVPRDASQKHEANLSTKRLYVSGVREDHNEQMFEDHFRKYGNVEKVEIIKDKNTGKYRGFAFISFDDYDCVDQACLDRSHMINGHRCDVKKALSKEEIAKAQQMDRDRDARGQRSRGNNRGQWAPPSGPNDRWGGPSGYPPGPNPWGPPAGGYSGYPATWGGPEPSGWGGGAAPQAQWQPGPAPSGPGPWQAPQGNYGPPGPHGGPPPPNSWTPVGSGSNWNANAGGGRY